VNIEVGPGWMELISIFAQALQNHVRESSDLRIDLIKEKWGLLAIHADGATAAELAVMQSCTSKAAKICCLCASAKASLHKHRRTGWLSTLCAPCAEDEFYEPY
jgi:hypothetical protein